MKPDTNRGISATGRTKKALQETHTSAIIGSTNRTKSTSTARLTTHRPTSSLTGFPHRPGLAPDMMISDRHISLVLGLLSLSVGASLLADVHTEHAPTIRARP